MKRRYSLKILKPETLAALRTALALFLGNSLVVPVLKDFNGSYFRVLPVAAVACFMVSCLQWNDVSADDASSNKSSRKESE